MSYLRDEGIGNWWLCSHCKVRDYEVLEEDGRQLCSRCYYKLLNRKQKRENWKFKLAERRNKEEIRRKEARQFYEILNSSGLLKEYQIGFISLDFV